MRKYLFCGLLAAMLIPAVPFAASADHDDDHGHHGHGHAYGHDWDHHKHEWHHHHHTDRENYYMEYPAVPVIVQRPVYVQPRPVYVEPAPSLNIVIPIH